MDIEVLRKANTLYSELADLSDEQTLSYLNSMPELDDDVKNLILRMRRNANQPSQVFDQKIAAAFQIDTGFQGTAKPGAIIGDFELLEKIGEGGMSQVFSARRVDTEIQKLVAIKIFSPMQGAKTLKDRFVAEQKILSTLSHPNIISIQHGGTTEDGQPFYVMELIEGAVSITTYADEHKLDTAERIALILTAAQALEHAHDNLVVHRDIKPSNLIIDHRGVLKVVDFGIAKLIVDSPSLEQKTAVVMTPSYAAPEQIQSKPITVRTDVFSLAAVCLSVLTHKTPFPDDRLIQACQTDDAHLQQTFKSLGLDSDLTNILNKALQQDPNRRYANMHGFSDDLSAWLQRKPVTATPDSFHYRLLKFSQRRRALSASIMVLFVTLSLALIMFSWQYKQIQTESNKAKAVKDFMLGAFSVTDPNAREGVDISAQDVLTMASLRLKDKNNMAPETRFELYQALGLAFGQLGFYNEAIEQLRASLLINPQDSRSISYLCQYLFNSEKINELRDTLSRVNEDEISDHQDRNRIRRVRANQLAYEGDYETALELTNSLGTSAENSLDLIQNKRLEAEIYYLMGQSEKPIQIIKSAIEASDLKPTNTLMMALNSDLIHYYDRIGDFDAAIDLALSSVANHRRILGNRHPGLGTVLNELSVFYRLKGDFENAYAAAQESRDLYISLYGDNSAGLSQAVSALGMLDYLNGRTDQAIQLFTQAADILRVVYSADHPETLVAEANLATIMNASGRAIEASKLLEHVYEAQLKTLGPNHRSTLITVQSLALNLAATGDITKALELAEDNWQRTSEHLGPGAPVTDNSQFVYGRIQLTAKNYQAALDLLLPLEEVLSDDNDVKHFSLMQKIADCYAGLNQPQPAERYYTAAIKGYQDIYGSEHTNTLQLRLDYAQFLKNSQRNDEALKETLAIQSMINLHAIVAPDLQRQLAEF